MAERTHKADSEYLCDLLSLWNLKGTDLNLDITSLGSTKPNTGVIFKKAASTGSTVSTDSDKLCSILDTSVKRPINDLSPVTAPISCGNGHTPYLQYCSSCKSINDNDSNWCSECGTVLLNKTPIKDELDLSCVRGVHEQHGLPDQAIRSKHSRNVCNASDGSLGVCPHSLSQSNVELVKDETTCTSTNIIEKEKNGTINFDADLSTNHRTHDSSAAIHVDASVKSAESMYVHVNSTLSQSSKSGNSKMQQTGKNSLHNGFPDSLASPKQTSNSSLHNTSSMSSSLLNIPRRWSSSSMYMWRKPSSLERLGTNSLRTHVEAEVVPRNYNATFLSKKHNYTEELNQSEGSKFNTRLGKKVLQALDNEQSVNGGLITKLESDGLSNIKSTQSLSARPTAMPSLELALVASESPQSEDTPHDTGLMYLPDELLLIILLNLSQTDIFACMLVCKRLYYVALDPSLWNNTEIRNCCLQQEHLLQISRRKPKAIKFYKCRGTVDPGHLHLFFQELSTTLKELQLTLCDLAPITGNGLLMYAACHCPNLKTIGIDWTAVSEEATSNCIHKIHRLEELCISQSGQVPRTLLKELFDRHGQWLKKLDIGNSNFPRICRVCEESTCKKSQSLITLSARLGRAQPRKWRTLYSVFPNLKHLFVYYKPDRRSHIFDTRYLSHIPLVSLSLKFSTDGLLRSDDCAIIALMTTLRYFTTNDITDDGLYQLCNGELCLISLDISDTAVTSRSFGIIRESSFSQTLVKLKMNYCYRPEYVSVIVKQSETTDQVRGCDKMSVDQEVEVLKAHCKSLQMVEL